MKISNANLYNFNNAITASKYPMAVDIDKLDPGITNTVKNLGKSPRGSAHDNFLHGILVAFDLTCSNKMWVEFERYHHADIVSSQSTMHKISKLAVSNCFNNFVTENTIKEVKRLAELYSSEPTPENYLTLLYNVPSGIELTAHIVTNYGQLKTMYLQRKNHRLPEWREFCKWILALPHFKDICITKEDCNES